MMNYITLGSAPADEECAQVGSEGYEFAAKKECRLFIEAIRKKCGPEPEGAELIIMGFNHDFGRYYEVVCRFDVGSPGEEYAYYCERNIPLTWEEVGMEGPFQRQNSAEKSFDEWKKAVENVINNTLMLSMDDLPDFDYYEMYTSGMSPNDVADSIMDDMLF